MIPAREALEKLREGNRRFVADIRAGETLCLPTRREELLSGQDPFAVILGCADSRVPAEIVFDQGLGDLFVVRVAGNIAARTQVGSVELALAHFRTRLVVVLGHSRCGAITATLRELQHPAAERSPNLAAIFEHVRASVEPLLAGEPDGDFDSIVSRGVKANVRASVDGLLRGSQMIRRLVADDGLLVVGAEYSLESGRVGFFEGLPEDD